MNCVDPLTGAPSPMESRIAALLSLDRDALLLNKSLQSPVRIAQYWYCDIVNGSYPEAYQARADVYLAITCPGVGRREFHCSLQHHVAARNDQGPVDPPRDALSRHATAGASSNPSTPDQRH